MNIEDIENMLHNYELDFIYPDKLDNSIIEKIYIYNLFRFQGIKDKTYEIEHKYEDIDYLITEYYSDCFSNNKISYSNLFKLIRYMIILCPSIRFTLTFSDKLSFFKVDKCNFYLNYFKTLSKNLTNELNIYALNSYLINVFEDGRMWSNGKFKIDLLTKDNQIFLNQIKQQID